MDTSSRSSDPQPQSGSASSGRWKTNVVIDELNRQAAWRERRATQPARYEEMVVPQQARSGLAITPVESSEAVDSTSWVADDRVPSWLLSLVVHLVIVLLLAIWTFPTAGSRGTQSSLVMNSPAEDRESELAQFETVNSTPVDAGEEVVGPEAFESMEDTVAESALLESPIKLPHPGQSHSTAGPVEAKASNESLVDMAELTLQIGGGTLADRSAASRSAAVQRGDTTAAAEDSLELALRWLADHQHNDGGWSFRLEDPQGPCRGQCEHGRKNPDDAPIPRTAATGLALLAFLGAGHTHEKGIYAENVRRGIYFLREEASQTSLGLDLQNGSMYGHGIATLALAEAFVITEDEELRELIQGTIFFAAGAQHSTGGWGYLPAGPPDMTLTAWHVVAIKTAELRGVRTPTQVIPQARDYVATLANPTRTRFGYKTPEPEVPATAMGVLLQLYFGALPNQTEMRDALDFLVAQGPSPTNVYYDYYAMLALHHSQHRDRKEFAEKLRKHLLETQSSEGHQRGSWNFEDRYGSVGGRLYTTAMCALILETPYRHVPLYDPYRPFSL